VCGRFASTRSSDDLAVLFGAADETRGQVPPRAEIAPTEAVTVVLERPHRVLRAMRWGLLPSWADDPATGAKRINARAETVATKPTYRAAFAARRCLVPADGWYEWPDGAPVLLRSADGAPLAFAGIYELWRDGSGEIVPTFAVITCAAPPPLAQVHARMPVCVAPNTWQKWLDPAERDADRLLGELLAIPPEIAVTAADEPLGRRGPVLRAKARQPKAAAPRSGAPAGSISGLPNDVPPTGQEPARRGPHVPAPRGEGLQLALFEGLHGN
jgi:putative SOS response-associated peptidase YedK